MSRYRFVSTMKAEGFPVQAACEAAEVSTSSYYDWCAKVAAGPTAAEWDEALVINEMHDIHAHLDDTYGSPRMTAELRQRGFCVNHKRTERLMAKNAIGVITRSCGSSISRRARRTFRVEQPTSPPDDAGGEGYANVEARPHATTE